MLALTLGVTKSPAEIDWFDVLGEGIVLLVAILWLTLIISSRPAGRVTEWLYYGSLLLVCSFFLDLLDEFIRYPAHIRTMSWLESLPAPIGMLALTYGLIGWHREQRVINRQLQGRELLLRDHRLLDPLTKLYAVDYLYAVLARDLELHRAEQRSLSLLMLNIRQFSAFNRQYGAAAGDDYLIKLSELCSSQLRASDVLCRYVGDRFVILLANTSLQQAKIFAQHMQQHLTKLNHHESNLKIDIVVNEITRLTAKQALQETEEMLKASKAGIAPSVLLPS
ncbi:GGDEF domain-containing protein [Alishewanella longhuensis]|uniref:diguanylate cyclase n=2 Tax=Alishewanella longhuensis TaxID=1091037 RepID=A0ABQ3KW32_9ALTE|nr:GGDEF domain-containing protein [Alishewanella longhuensis]